MRCNSCTDIIDVPTMKKIEGKWIVEDFCDRCLNEYVYGVDSLNYKWKAHEHLTEAGYKGFIKAPND